VFCQITNPLRRDPHTCTLSSNLHFNNIPLRSARSRSFLYIIITWVSFNNPKLFLQNLYFLTPLPNVLRKFCQFITTKDGVQNSKQGGFLQFLPTSAQTEPPPGIPNYPFKSRYSGKCFYHNQHGLCLELYTACTSIIHMYFLQTWMLHTPTQRYDLFWLLHAVNHPTKNRVNPLPVGATAPLTGGLDCSSPGTAESWDWKCLATEQVGRR